MLTEREERILRILADSDRREPVRAYERDAVRAAMEEIERLRVENERLRVENAELRGENTCVTVLSGTWRIVDRKLPESGETTS